MNEQKQHLLTSTGETIAEWESVVLRAFIRGAKSMPIIASGILVIVAVGYLVGWLRARAYYTEFGAGWLVGELTTYQLLCFAFSPLAWMTFCIFAQLSDLAVNRQQPWRQLKFGIILCVISISLSVITLFLKSKYPILMETSAWVASISWILFSVIILANILLEVEKRSGRWHAEAIWILFVVAFLGIYSAPKQLGESEGLRDLDSNRTQLPTIILRNGDSSWHLLLSSNERVFGVKRDEQGKIIVRNFDIGKISLRCDSKTSGCDK